MLLLACCSHLKLFSIFVESSYWLSRRPCKEKEKRSLRGSSEIFLTNTFEVTKKDSFIAQKPKREGLLVQVAQSCTLINFKANLFFCDNVYYPSFVPSENQIKNRLKCGKKLCRCRDFHFGRAKIMTPYVEVQHLDLLFCARLDTSTRDKLRRSSARRPCIWEYHFLPNGSETRAISGSRRSRPLKV